MHLTSGIIDEHSHIAISKGVNESINQSQQKLALVMSLKLMIIIFTELAGGTVAAQLLHGSANPIGGQSAIVSVGE